ncbi:MAG: hypothetical protein EPN45_21200 [Rhizobiaceae bacterium]|nr:MAG: hypothetical protein EPN45_21200 [Rhizobiaceae bacterium]
MKTILGSRVRDKITGFTGIVTGRCEYISGCNQALVAPSAKEDGTLPDSHWVDEQRLDRLDDSLVALDNGATPGFDRAAPKR